MSRVCYLAEVGVFERGRTECDGRLVRVHLIPRQLLRRHRIDPDDPRAWVWACGGPMGNAGHHGELDFSRTLRVPRAAIPAAVEELALEAGLLWWLDRTYGRRKADRRAGPQGPVAEDA